MTKSFAFGLSLVDLIRKLSYRYEHPIDYLAAISERLYSPAARLDIGIDASSIHLSSERELGPEFFDEISKGRLNAIASAIPPISDYATVEITSGRWGLQIDQSRSIRITPLEDIISGTRVVIQRAGNEADKENDRIIHLYSDSDLEVSLNGQEISPQGKFRFQNGVYAGTIEYDPRSEGGLHIFYKGRRISTIPLTRAINVNLLSHPFEATITRSRVKMGREGERELFDKVIPAAFIQYLNSEMVQEMKGKSLSSYQIITRAIYDAVANEALRSMVVGDLDMRGDLRLRELKSLLGVRRTEATGHEGFAYDSQTGVLKVPNSQLICRPVFELALQAANHMGSDPKAQLRAYKTLTGIARR